MTEERLWLGVPEFFVSMRPTSHGSETANSDDLARAGGFALPSYTISWDTTLRPAHSEIDFATIPG
ncbi:hypothetical protein ACQPTN_06830 [Bradyrhizobium sp. 13971]